MKLIPLSGKYAIGKYANAVVDDEDFADIFMYSWKAKPNENGTHVYAVRNIILPNGRNKMLRMHRVILGTPYDGYLDIDHINRNTMDNRRENLRLVTRSVNIRNTTDSIKLSRIDQAKKRIINMRLISKLKAEERMIGRFCPVEFTTCGWCRKAFRKKRPTQKYCIKAHKYSASFNRYLNRKRQRTTYEERRG